MQRTTRGRAADRGGRALILLLLLVAAGFLIWKFAPSWTSKNPLEKQEPESVTLDGPVHVRPGDTQTYLVTLRYPKPLHPTSSYWVEAQVVENGLGERLLDDEVRIGMRAGSVAGRGSFTLSCAAEGGGRFVLRGEDGSSSADSAWQISASLQDQANSAAYRSRSTLNVICADR